MSDAVRNVAISPLKKPGVLSFFAGALTFGLYNVYLQNTYDEHYEQISHLKVQPYNPVITINVK